ncbi:MAG: hypothetical protein M3P18_04280 [Actinomycetota bacterium]|nr:hypothetical protein [Actinomycetota bacterium]
MTEDFDYFLAEVKRLTHAELTDADVEEESFRLMIRAAEVLSEDDYNRLGKEFLAEGMKAEVARDAFAFSHEQVVKHNVKTVGELPPDVRDEVFRRVQVAEAMGDPALKIIHDDDGGIDILVQVPEQFADHGEPE